MYMPRDMVEPTVWLLLGDKLGDNAQVEALAGALGWPVVRRHLSFREPYIHGKPEFRPDLYHIDPESSDRLQPPWPDLILTIGRRPSMAALWVKQQSGGRTKVALIGRPKKQFDAFDLVIGTPQYHLPRRPNVINLDLPLMRVDPNRLAEQRAQWQDALEPLPRPLIAVLVGGPTKPFALDAAAIARLVARVEALQQDEGGTLYFTTSRRTPPEVADALLAALPPGARFFRWEPDAAGNPTTSDNPYLGLLAHADRFVVTGDSISMMVEVASLGRPLAIFPLPLRRQHLSRLRHGLRRLFQAAPRDLPKLHASLYRQELAVPLGRPFRQPARIPQNERDRVVRHLEALMETPGNSPETQGEDAIRRQRRRGYVRAGLGLMIYAALAVFAAVY
ncbi:mitochondrial fission ELM1 family protein [Fodinicurvata sediminis]|uniref:mitochondrial fission ELM1 family protein n=1 Tax=Fodinicurvata sediminis TaxID=1121832 RepID=UPI00041AD4A8|nr:mitochondrial fission ELM1 family protein [Fodinicurvata sediminis]